MTFLMYTGGSGTNEMHIYICLISATKTSVLHIKRHLYHSDKYHLDTIATITNYYYYFYYITIIIITSLNWSHNGSTNYTADSMSQNRCQRPLTNCHAAETARKLWRKDDPGPHDFPDIYLSIKWFQDVANALFKRLAPL